MAIKSDWVPTVRPERLNLPGQLARYFIESRLTVLLIIAILAQYPTIGGDQILMFLLEMTLIVGVWSLIRQRFWFVFHSRLLSSRVGYSGWLGYPKSGRVLAELRRALRPPAEQAALDQERWGIKLDTLRSYGAHSIRIPAVQVAWF